VGLRGRAFQILFSMKKSKYFINESSYLKNSRDRIRNFATTNLKIMYPPELVQPMKEDLTRVGFQQLVSASEVDAAIPTSQGVALVVVNSVCGCAAGNLRPGVKMSLEQATKKPDHLLTVFAGVDSEATQQARKYFLPFPPSSPSVALFKDGKLVHFLERHNIEGVTAAMIAENLEAAYEEFC
jgi:putative YphP/YqiW family bacilliredoxin